MERPRLAALAAEVGRLRAEGAAVPDALAALGGAFDDALLGVAHLACAVVDSRELVRAVARFCAAGRNDLLAAVLDAALVRGNVRALAAVRDAAGWLGRRVEERVWLAREGLPAFDLYRDERAGRSFVAPEDAKLIAAEVRRVAPDTEAFFAEVLAGLGPSYPADRRALLERLARADEPVIPTPPDPRGDLDARLREHFARSGRRVLRTFQAARDGRDPRAGVYLVLDSDGVAKVLKELLTNHLVRGEEGGDREVEARVVGLASIAAVHGRERPFPGVELRRMAFSYGQGLLDFVREGRRLEAARAFDVGAALASALADVHERGVLYLDLRPQNVLVHPDGVRLLDLDSTRAVGGLDEEVATHLYDARYAPPELVLLGRASAASAVFSLGVLLHQLLSGEHPFDLGAAALPDEHDPFSMLVRFALASATCPYEGGLERHLGREPRSALLARMLEPDPSMRPSMRDVATALAGAPARLPSAPRPRGRRPRERNTILVPARMGIPHRGHVELCARVAELGYRVLVSLMRAYTLTERDPLPKWLVLKMLARSLLDRGFGPEDFDFVLTPFYETDEELRLHFTMLPGREDLVGVCTTAEEAAALFPDLQQLDQRALFGIEGRAHSDLSWGESLRSAVRRGDRDAFDRLAASGVEQVLSFEELRAHPSALVPFVRRAEFALFDAEGRELAKGRLRRYLAPELGIAQHLSAKGVPSRVVDLYARDTVAIVSGVEGILAYESTAFDDGRAVLRYTFRP